MMARNPRVALVTVVAEGLLGRLAFGMVSFAFPLYALDLGLSLAQIGLLVSLRTVVVLPLKPVAGWLADRVGVRTVYLSGAFARTLAAAGLLFAGGFLGLAAIRLLQGASAAGRDVASLGVIARDAQNRVGTVYSWYASAKHVGGVAGAGIAGLVIAATGGYQTVFVLVLILSVLPTAAAWFGLREVPDERSEAAEAGADEADEPDAGFVSLIRELSGLASVGMLVSASAYMVHGIFPVLATEYAGLGEAEAGLIYSLSAVVFVVAGPAFGWMVDRRGRLVGIAWRSAANVGSSVLYLVSPTFVGLALARSVDDSGKAAFRPAWASAMAEAADEDPPRRGRRLGALDTSQSIGEAVGPALAGLLWQSGGVVALFAARIAIAVVAELMALRVFGELRGRRPRLARLVAVATYLTPPIIGIAAAGIWLGGTFGWGESSPLPADISVASAMILLGVIAGTLAGRVTVRRKAYPADRE
jgi:MFS family permease